MRLLGHLTDILGSGGVGSGSGSLVTSMKLSIFADGSIEASLCSLQVSQLMFTWSSLLGDADW